MLKHKNLIVFAVCIWHFGGFSTDKGTVCHSASGGDSFYHFGYYFYIYAVYANIIEEKQRLCPLYQHVVDTHRDQVDSNGVILFCFRG